MCASFLFKFPQVFLAFLAISDLWSGFVYHRVKVISLINITQYNIILVVLYEVELLSLISCHHISDFVSQWQLVYEGKNAQWAFWCCPCNSLRLSRWMLSQDVWWMITWLLLLYMDRPWLRSSHCLEGSLNSHQSIREAALVSLPW